jgi:hypothetical protein
MKFSTAWQDQLKMYTVIPVVLKPIQDEFEAGTYDRENIYAQLVKVLSNCEYEFINCTCVDGLWLLRRLLFEIEERNGLSEFDTYLKRVLEENDLKESIKNELLSDLKHSLCQAGSYEENENDAGFSEYEFLVNHIESVIGKEINW